MGWGEKIARNAKIAKDWQNFRGSPPKCLQQLFGFFGNVISRNSEKLIST
jgi:hypothetical protein